MPKRISPALTSASAVRPNRYGVAVRAPNFVLDFENGDMDTFGLDSRVTFSRNSPATRFNSSGLLEVIGHNLATWSQPSSVSYDSLTATTPVLVQTRVPFRDGSPTAITVTFPGSNVIVTANGGAPNTQSQVTVSRYYKAVTQNYTFQAGFGSTNGTGSGNVASSVTVSGGRVTAVGNALVKFDNFDDGWFRLYCTVTATGSTGNIGVVENAVSPAGSSFTIGHTQVENGPLVSALSITTGVPNSGPRFDYDPGKVVAQNLVANSGTMTGFSTASAAGITAQQVGSGTDQYGTYADFRFFGTGTGTGYPSFRILSSMNIVKGQALASSCRIQRIAGSSPRPMTYVQQELTSAGAYIRGLGSAVVDMAATEPVTYTIQNQTVQDSSTARANVLITPSHYGLGDVVDVTLRVWQPQANFGLTLLPYTPTSGVPITQCAPLGLLVEEARTNLLLWSRDFTNAAWTKTAVTATPTMGIDGVADSADLITTDATMTDVLSQSVNITANVAVTLSAILKRGNSDWVRFGGRDNAYADGCNAWFNLATGAKGSVTANGTGTGWTSEIQNLGGGWYRVSVSGVINPTSTIATMILVSTTGNGSTSKVANATYAIDCAQIEVGYNVTSPIITTSAPVTRGADSAAVNSVGSWWRGRGTVSADVRFGAMGSSAQTALCMSNGFSGERLFFRRTSGRVQDSNIVVGGVSRGSPLPAVAITDFARTKLSMTFDRAGSINAQNGILSTPGGAIPTPPNVTKLEIGAMLGGAYLNGHIQSIAYIPERVGNSEIANLTR